MADATARWIIGGDRVGCRVPSARSGQRFRRCGQAKPRVAMAVQALGSFAPRGICPAGDDQACCQRREGKRAT
jgi:hypothetical protein